MKFLLRNSWYSILERHASKHLKGARVSRLSIWQNWNKQFSCKKNKSIRFATFRKVSFTSVWESFVISDFACQAPWWHIMKSLGVLVKQFLIDFQLLKNYLHLWPSYNGFTCTGLFISFLLVWEKAACACSAVILIEKVRLSINCVSLFHLIRFINKVTWL